MNDCNLNVINIYYKIFMLIYFRKVIKVHFSSENILNIKCDVLCTGMYCVPVIDLKGFSLDFLASYQTKPCLFNRCACPQVILRAPTFSFVRGMRLR